MAGGFGTRLKGFLGDTPKPLAPVNGKPFLRYLVKNLKEQGISKIHLSLYHMAEKIIEEFKGEAGIEFHIEDAPLGTGGAVLFNLQFIKSPHVLIVNGDVICSISIEQMLQFHLQEQSIFTIATTNYKNPERFGTLTIDQSFNITQFKEKQLLKSGYINCGIYIADTSILTHSLIKLNKQVFSLEFDFFMQNRIKLMAFKSEASFIDIGVIEDYKKVQNFMPLFIAKGYFN